MRILQNNKTTIGGALSAFGSFVMFSQQLHMIAWPNWVLAVAMFGASGGLALFGWFAKDYSDPTTPPVARVCSKCGLSLSSGWKMCPVCGGEPVAGTEK